MHCIPSPSLRLSILLAISVDYPWNPIPLCRTSIPCNFVIRSRMTLLSLLFPFGSRRLLEARCAYNLPRADLSKKSINHIITIQVFPLLNVWWYCFFQITSIVIYHRYEHSKSSIMDGSLWREKDDLSLPGHRPCSHNPTTASPLPNHTSKLYRSAWVGAVFDLSSLSWRPLLFAPWSYTSRHRQHFMMVSASKTVSFSHGWPGGRAPLVRVIFVLPTYTQ